MTETEFKDIEKKYRAETHRWKTFYPGQIVYTTDAWGFSIDYFKHEIISIDVPNRRATCFDHSLQQTVTIGWFETAEELADRGITFKEK